MTRVELKWKGQKETPSGFPFPSPKKVLGVLLRQKKDMWKNSIFFKYYILNKYFLSTNSASEITDEKIYFQPSTCLHCRELNLYTNRTLKLYK